MIDFTNYEEASESVKESAVNLADALRRVATVIERGHASVNTIGDLVTDIDTLADLIREQYKLLDWQLTVQDSCEGELERQSRFDFYDRLSCEAARRMDDAANWKDYETAFEQSVRCKIFDYVKVDMSR